MGWITGSVALILAWVSGYCFGWIAGTKDTERRWSDAVKRADNDRQRQAGATADLPPAASGPK